MGEKKRGLSAKAIGKMLLSGAMIYAVTTPGPLILNWPEDPNMDVPVSAVMCEQDFNDTPEGHTPDVFSEEKAFTLIDVNNPFDVVSTYRLESQGLPLYIYGKDTIQDTLPEQTWQNHTILAPLTAGRVSINGESTPAEKSEADGVIAALMEANGFEEVPHEGALYETLTTWIEPNKYEAPLEYHDTDTYVQAVNALQRGRGTRIISPFSGDDPLDEQLVDRWIFPSYYFFERYKPGEYDVFLEVSQADGRVFTKDGCTFHLQTGPRITTITKNGDTVVDVTIDYGSHTEDILEGEVPLDDLAGELILYDKTGMPYLFDLGLLTSQMNDRQIHAMWLAPVMHSMNLSYLELLALNGISDSLDAIVPEQRHISLMQGETIVGVNPNKLEHYLSMRTYHQYVAGLIGHPLEASRVSVIIINPLDSSGEGMHRKYRLNDPDKLIDEFITELFEVSNGNAVYEVVHRQVINEFLQFTNEFIFDEHSFNECMKEEHPYCDSEQPDRPMADLTFFFEEYSICENVWEQNISEVWIIGPPWIGLEETTINGPSLQLATWRVMTPSCGKTLPIMGFNSSRGVAEMLHSYGHRVEGMMRYFDKDEFEKFDSQQERYGIDMRLSHEDQQDAISLPETTACGNIHFPPNGVSHYDYGNKESFVDSTCMDWLNYPNLVGESENINCEAWGCNEQGFLSWWLSHIPHDDRGSDKQGSESNWWRYILRPDAPD